MEILKFKKWRLKNLLTNNTTIKLGILKKWKNRVVKLKNQQKSNLKPNFLKNWRSKFK